MVDSTWVLVGRALVGKDFVPETDRAIEVRDGRIVAIHAQRAVAGRVRRAPIVHRFPDGVALPGLHDLHVHLGQPADGSAFPGVTGESDAFLATLMTRNAFTALSAGVTQVRDCGARPTALFGFRQAARLFRAMPHLFLSGAPITITGGHTRDLGGEADGPEGVRLAVRRMVKWGADGIKVVASGGGTPGTASHRPSFRPEELQALVDEAHRLGRRVGVHCLSAEAIEDAVMAGADQIEHGWFLIDDAGHQAFDPRVADLLASRQVPVVPTLAVGAYMTDQSGHADATMPDADRERWERLRDGGLETVRRLHGAGVPLLVGTDAGWRYTPFDAVYTELALLQEAGVSWSDALAGATWRAAEALQHSDGGVLAPGYRADVTVVRPDWVPAPGRVCPSATVVQGVILAGQWVGPLPRVAAGNHEQGVVR